MNPIEILKERIAERFPSAHLAIDKPLNAGGNWSLDVTLGDTLTAIDWDPRQGFGVCSCADPNDHAYGGGPDKVFENVNLVFEWFVERHSS